MKVGTDGVLLGAWCGRERELERQSRSGDCPSERWLDVGTGTGVIALMLAQRFPQAEVDALEPDRAACEDARYNFAESPWGARLHLLPMRLQEYVTRATVRYDHIVSNPPYFVEALPSPDAARTQARHAGTLPYDALLDGAAVLLKETGTFSLILPPEESRRFRPGDGSGMVVAADDRGFVYRAFRGTSGADAMGTADADGAEHATLAGGRSVVDPWRGRGVHACLSDVDPGFLSAFLRRFPKKNVVLLDKKQEGYRLFEKVR